MEILLEPLSWDNIDDVIANHNSGNECYPLPKNDHEAERLLRRVDNNRRHNIGCDFAAYDLARSDLFVGGGQTIIFKGVCHIGYWVVKSCRKQGYGRAIVKKLEKYGVARLPHFEQFNANIDIRNIGSIALATALGYRVSGDAENGSWLLSKAR